MNLGLCKNSCLNISALWFISSPFSWEDQIILAVTLLNTTLDESLPLAPKNSSLLTSCGQHLILLTKSAYRLE